MSIFTLSDFFNPNTYIVDRNTILAVVLSSVIMIVWMVFFMPSPQPPAKQTPKPKQEQAQTLERDEPESSAKPADTDSVLTEVQSGVEQLVTVESDLYKATFSSKGGTLRSFELKKFTKWNRKTPIQLVHKGKEGALGLEFSTPWNRSVETRSLFFKPQNLAGNKLTVGDKSELVYSLPIKGGELRQIYTFKKGSYEVGYRIESTNPSAFSTGQGYDLVWYGGIPFSEQGVFQEAEGASAHARWGGELVMFDIGAGKEQNKLMTGQVDWVSVKNRFFTSVIIPTKTPKGAELTGRMIGDKTNPKYFEDYTARFEMPPLKAEKADSYKLYLGPIERETLEPYNLDLYGMIDFGSFLGGMLRFISLYIFLPVFGFLHTFIPNYGIIILLFALLVKIVLHPLTASSMKSMAKMKAMQPKMQEIQEKHKDNPAKQQEAMMKLYKEAGANPLGGCLPMLLQMPILFAMYRFFPNAIELRQQGFLWATDLSAPDVLLHLPFAIPMYGEIITGFSLLMTISMIVQMKVQGTSTPDQPGMQVFMYIMPVMMLVIFNGLSSGLNLYYLAFNIYSVIQQRWINTHLEKAGLIEAKPAKTKTSTKKK
ncbi:MAG TPA: membrane protein insertase YidC [Rhodothermales bacterium]|nr:membrane protein insertase YidC [Rhodothermales bacterium]